MKFHAFLLPALLLGSGVLSDETHWDEAKLSQPVYNVRMEHNVRVPMSSTASRCLT